MSPDGRQLNLPKREEEILNFWGEHKIFEKTLAQTQKGKRFVFYEGPPTANGSPGIHHFEARAFKDVIPRYQTMRGRSVERKAGWDTHGLPVEIQVEKELGLKSKKDIERYGIAKFNAKCRESVWRFKTEWDRFTKRIGYWLDLDHPYITYEASYIETLWWVIGQFAKKKLLYRDFKVVPWCPRCGTALSTHELGQGYETVKDRSVYARFPLKSDDRRWRNAAILSWTTTPWTLPGNVALAVNPSEAYLIVPDPEARGRWIILGKKNFDLLIDRHILPPEYHNRVMLDDIDEVKGKDLVGLEYEPPFSVQELSSSAAHKVYAADFVTMEEGTGVVHTAVMYGDDDYRLGTAVGLPKFHTVDETGHFIKEVGEGLGGLFVKDAKTEDVIIGSLKRRGLLFAEEQYEHEYPFCWRCETPLIYYARQAWWVKTTAVKKQLVANNKKIHWVPDHLKTGRFGEFLGEVRDWAFSRERYWGTPLPVWECQACEYQTVVGSLIELTERSYEPRTKLILARHAEAENNRRHVLSSDVGEGSPPLSEHGRERAEGMARELRGLGIDFIFSSDVRRARETAEIIGKAVGKPVMLDPRLREITMGEFEGKPEHVYGDYFHDQAEKYGKTVPGGESLRDVKKRMVSFALEIQARHPGKTVLAVSHGDPLWALRGALSGFDDQRAAEDTSLFVPRGTYQAHVIPNLPFDTGGDIDLHRPYVDEIRLTCERCSGEMRRVPEVCDVWFDSGAMPFAQAHYPFAFTKKHEAGSTKQGTELPYPADYICEGVDQTRGWFYTLLAVSTLLGRGVSYRNVISLGHVLDKRGQKMSKSRGNVVEPFAMVEKYGTDAIRWYFYTVNAPGDPKRFDEQDILLRLRGALSTFWNSFVFFDTYVEKAKIKNQKSKSSHALDRWVGVKLDLLTLEVTERLENYDIVGAARLLDHFVVEDFSNWYLRRSRRRFQRPAGEAEKEEAAAITGSALLRLAELMAPFTPFLAEIIYRELKPKLGLTEESVHLRTWPKATPKAKNPASAEATAGKQKPRSLLDGMAEVRRLAALALAERAKAGIKVRQPLAMLRIKNPESRIRDLLDVLKEEVNVKEVVIDPAIQGEVELDIALTAELREEGAVREFIRNIQELRRDAGLKPGDRVRVQVSGTDVLPSFIGRWVPFIQREAGATAVEVGGKRQVTPSRDVTLEGRQLWIGIKKV